MIHPDRWNVRFLQLAKLVSSWSRDPSTKVGAVIVDPNKRIVSLGFNGFPQGMSDHDYMYNERDVKLSRVIHAEMNAVLFAGTVPANSVLYTYPLLPCDRCVVHMLQAGIKHFVSLEPSAEHQERWGKAMYNTMAYVAEAGGEYLLYPQKAIL